MRPHPKSTQEERQKWEGCGQHQECDDVFVLHDYFVERCKDKTVEEGYRDCLKRIIIIFLSIIWSKDFDGAIKLCFNHFMKCLVNRHKFRPMVKKINLSILRKIIHKYDKISRSSLNGNRCKTPNIRMYKIKRCRRKGITIIKGQFCLFAKMTGSSIKFLKLNWT